MYERPILKEVLGRIREKRRFIQVLSGPRQTGKTTLAQQAIEKKQIPAHYASADDPALKDRIWLEEQWEIGRNLAKKKPALLILDEIQKIPNWSETVKRLWDEDTAGKRPLHVILLGSSTLLVRRGLTESLAGRFEMLPVIHWTYREMKDAFGWDLETYLFFGGYPGSATLIEDEERWSNYILNSLVETTISRDILLMSRVDKPALLRRLFELGCSYSGQILSYQKMTGHLQDAGNTTTLAHYLQLLTAAGLITGLSKFSGREIHQRASSPKILVLNTALQSVFSRLSLAKAKADRSFWGRLVESSVGAHIYNSSVGRQAELFYWLDHNQEMDYVLKKGNQLAAIEVKSGRRRDHLPGMKVFADRFSPGKKILVGADGIPLEEFFTTDPLKLVD